MFTLLGLQLAIRPHIISHQNSTGKCGHLQSLACSPLLVDYQISKCRTHHVCFRLVFPSRLPWANSLRVGTEEPLTPAAPEWGLGSQMNLVALGKQREARVTDGVGVIPRATLGGGAGGREGDAKRGNKDQGEGLMVRKALDMAPCRKLF